MPQNITTDYFLKYSNTSGAVPTAAQLPERVLAINLADKKLFFNSGGTIYSILDSTQVAAASHTHSISQVTGLQSALDALSSSISSTGGAALQSSNNLSDVASASAARTNLDVFSKGEVSSAISSASSSANSYADGVALSAKNDAKSYTDGKISDLINGAPTILDTLKEIADALAAGDSVATALAGQISAVSSRVTALEGQNLDSRVTSLEGVNAGSRLSSLEGDVSSLQSTVMLKSNNLSDVASVSAARANLSVYSKSEIETMFQSLDGGSF